MAEYINREETKRELSEWFISLNRPHLLSRDDTMFLLDNIPAADVAPVVRCKDCAHKTEMGNCGHPRYHGILPSAYPYDFCSYGVRKDGDDDAKEN